VWERHRKTESGNEMAQPPRTVRGKRLERTLDERWSSIVMVMLTHTSKHS
jgi:hypothetical protein